MRGQSIWVPSDVAEAIRAMLGEPGSEWLSELHLVAAVLAHQWQVTIDRPFDWALSYVAEARLPDGNEVVLKISPWRAETRAEIRALRLYGGVGTCRLLAADEEHAALLLERLRPLRRLERIAVADDDAATRIGAGLMRRLSRPADEVRDQTDLIPLSDSVLDAFARHRSRFGGPGPIPAAIIEGAEAIALELLSSPPPDMLLHGDLQLDTILSAEREPWLAVSPRGLLGDPCYDAGAFLHYPESFSGPMSPAILHRRLDILADELGYDRARMRGWGVVRTVLLACREQLWRDYNVQNLLATAESLLEL